MGLLLENPTPNRNILAVDYKNNVMTLTVDSVAPRDDCCSTPSIKLNVQACKPLRVILKGSEHQ